MAELEQPDLTTLTVQLLSAYVANNSVASEDLAALITTTRTALSGEPKAETPTEPEYPAAVTVRKSLASRDHILSMIDGKPYKTLKRHLTTHGLTPADYRARYNLSKDYPMVAPGYSEQRREVAQRLGLGRKANIPATDATSNGSPPVELSVTTEALQPDDTSSASSPKTRGPKVQAKPADATHSKRRNSKAAPSPAETVTAQTPPPAVATMADDAATAPEPSVEQETVRAEATIAKKPGRKTGQKSVLATPSKPRARKPATAVEASLPPANAVAPTTPEPEDKTGLKSGSSNVSRSRKTNAKAPNPKTKPARKAKTEATPTE